MTLPEFSIAVWCVPHRGRGFLAEIDTVLIDDDLPGGHLQSSEHVANMSTFPELQLDRPVREFDVIQQQIEHLLHLADQSSYSLGEHSRTLMLGGSHYGLRMARGYQQVSIVWYGRFEDQDANVRALFAAVESIANATSA